jgi:hypothetical protein
MTVTIGQLQGGALRFFHASQGRVAQMPLLQSWAWRYKPRPAQFLQRNKFGSRL